MSRWWPADAVASQAQAYQRSPLEPVPAERTSQRRWVFQQRLDRFCAGQLCPRRECEGEVGRHLQYVRLASGFEMLTSSPQ